ncbi:MAG: site-2 protease family protein [Solirubrobacterales bacterium]|nr:site-2 protease family protein [Solirubrobacterales bacterium]
MSWFLAIAGFCVLIVLHEAGHFAAAKAVGMRVERFALFFPPLLFKVRRGETEYGIGAIPLGGYVRITGMNPNEEVPPEVAHRSYYRQPVWKRVVVIAAGPLVNVLLAFVIIWGLFVFKGQSEPTTEVAVINKGEPAAQVLRLGDRIVAVDGKQGDAATLREAIGSHTCKGTPKDGCKATTPAKITILRDGRAQVVEAYPRYNAAVERTLLGFQFDTHYVTVPPGEAVGDSVTGMWRITTGTVSAIARIFYDSEARKEVSGVVGSTKVVQQSFQEDQIVQAITLLAIISLSLAIVNLFPFLPLDGGHIFWAVAEKVRGRAIPFRVMEQASVVGFVLVIMLFAIGLTNDIDRLRGEGFQLR